MALQTVYGSDGKGDYCGTPGEYQRIHEALNECTAKLHKVEAENEILMTILKSRG